MKVCPSCDKRFGGLEWSCPACAFEPRREGGFPLFAPDLAVNSNEGFSETSLQALAEAEPQSFWFRGRNRLLTWALRRYFPAAQSMLEIGCGNGFVLSGIQQAAPTMRLAGSELSVEGLRMASARLPGASLQQMDARHIPYEDEFDVVGAFDALEHIEDDEVALAAIQRSVRPGGGVMITVPQHPRLWGPSDAVAHHFRRYKRRELVEKVRQAGFRVVRVTSFVSLLLPLMALARARERRSATYDPMAELQIAAPVQSILGGILSLETQLIRAGVSFPAGGSLLLLGEKV